MKRRTASLVILFFVFLSHCAFASEELPCDDAKTYPIPRSEMEDIIKDWFQKSGFTLMRSPEKTGMIRIRAQQGNETWDISLLQKSPLATEIQAAYSYDRNPDPSHVQALWNFINGYYKGASADVAASNSAIPVPVLSHIESVACIAAQVKGDDIQFSGFVVDPSGVIMSTAHNLVGLRKLSVTLFDGQTIPGRIIRIDYERDLALIDVDMEFSAHVSLAEGVKLLGMGQKIYSVGCPENLGGTIYSGFINGPPRSVEGHPLWQVSMKVYPGSSGSPVFNDKGTLVAVVKARHKGTDSLGFLIPYETIQAFIRELSLQRGNATITTQ